MISAVHTRNSLVMWAQDKTFSFVLKTPPTSTLLAKAAGVQKGSGTPNGPAVGFVTPEQIKVVSWDMFGFPKERIFLCYSRQGALCGRINHQSARFAIVLCRKLLRQKCQISIVGPSTQPFEPSWALQEIWALLSRNPNRYHRNKDKFNVQNTVERC